MIPRDGQCISIWQDSVEELASSVSTDTNQLFDVAIVGGGITGMATAALLQESGKKCIVLEAKQLCFGTTGGTTAHINSWLDTSYSTIRNKFNRDTAKLVADSVLEANKLISKNVEQYNIDCTYQNCDAYLFANNDEQEKMLERMSVAANDCGVTNEYTAQIPLAFPFTKAIRIPNQAKFNPVQYVYALANAFTRAGGVILQNCRVMGIHENDVVEIETTMNHLKAKHLVYATHIPPGINLLHLECSPYRSYAMAIELKNGNYAEEEIYDMDDPYHYYRSQVIDGKPYLIAGGKDHLTGHHSNTKECFLQLEAHLKRNFDISNIAWRWSSQYFESADGLPYIGILPGSDGKVLVATGFGGNGMPYSHVAAKLLSDIINNRQSPLFSVYEPRRIKPVAGFKQFITQNADVVKQMFSKWFTGESLSELADLAPGEARVIYFDDEKIALFKDDHGKLFSVNPVCTHLKCGVQWNTVERSWDCPCHGARYHYDGSVITGPATFKLEPVKIQEEQSAQ